METVITLCGNSDQVFPTFPRQAIRHYGPFEDPVNATGTEAKKLAGFRRVCDEIRRISESYAAGRHNQLCPVHNPG